VRRSPDPPQAASGKHIGAVIREKRRLPATAKTATFSLVIDLRENPTRSFSSSRLTDRLEWKVVPWSELARDADVYEASGKPRIGLFVANNPINNIDPFGLTFISKAVIFVIKLAKGGKAVGVKVGNVAEAVKSAEEGAQFIKCPSKDAARKAAQEFGSGKPPIHEVDTKTGVPHYHDVARQSHFLYSLAGALTLSYYAQGGSTFEQVAAGSLDLINPLSLPQDIIDISDALSGDSGGSNPCPCQ